MTQLLKHHSDARKNTSLESYVETVADDLIRKMAIDKTVSNSYRRLLANAITMAAENQKTAYKTSQEVKHLRHLSTTDEVTHALNRRGFSIALRQTLERARRHGETGFLLIIDMDGFKQINDNFGHLAGDKVLKTVADCLKKQTRSLDNIARIGGDEFAVIITNISTELGMKKVRELEKTINSLTFIWEGHSINIRASFGHEAYGTHEEEDGLLARADSNMYAKKKHRQQAISYASD